MALSVALLVLVLVLLSLGGMVEVPAAGVAGGILLAALAVHPPLPGVGGVSAELPRRILQILRKPTGPGQAAPVLISDFGGYYGLF